MNNRRSSKWREYIRILKQDNNTKVNFWPFLQSADGQPWITVTLADLYSAIH